MGIEPTYLAWKASILPLNYTRTRRAAVINEMLRSFPGFHSRNRKIGLISSPMDAFYSNV